jgi:FkbM family methyltransferase
VALSSIKGKRELHIPIDGGRLATAMATFGAVQGEYKSTLVQVHVLDDYSFKNVAFIKIDVEGHELEVL